jgi:hypothetical protein
MIFQELNGLTRICTDDTDFEAGNKNEDGYQDLFSFIGQRQVLPVIASVGAECRNGIVPEWDMALGEGFVGFGRRWSSILGIAGL